MNKPLFSIVVLLSGKGTNLQAIMHAIDKGLPIKILAVISNRENAFGIDRAKKAHIATHIVSRQHFPNCNDFDAELSRLIEQYNPRLILLAGFMRRLGPAFVSRYYGKIINIHPSLLPKYPGLNTHQNVLDAKDKMHGVTIHFVNEAIDSGPIICQSSISVNPDDTKEKLQSRIHEVEHKMYPLVLAWFADSKICLKNKQVYVNNHLTSKTGVFIELSAEATSAKFIK